MLRAALLRHGRRAFVIGGAATATTAVSAALCEAGNATAGVPKFVLGGDRYDQREFTGRLQHIQSLIDMRNIFITDEQVKSAQALLAEYKSKGAAPKGASDADLWEAQRVVGAVIHGPTGETMPLIGRMSMFVPVNVPIAAGLIMSQSVAASVFWQWLNQTYNVVNNYVNRAGPTVEMGPLVQSYVLAVGSACGIAIGAKSLLKAVPALQAFGLFVPYLAVITAGTCNVGFTRMDEIRNGIDVSDADGNVLGRSVAAGKIAVFKTVTTRSCFLPIFPLVIPPLTMKALGAVAGLVPGSAAAIVAELSIITCSMSIGLPAALALAPLRMELDPTSLEPEFHALKGKDGKSLTTVYAAKGM